MKWFAMVFVCTVLVSWSVCRGDQLSPNARWGKVAARAEKAFKQSEDAQKSSWEKMRRRVLQKWHNPALPGQKTFVEYFDHDTSRVKVDYENGKVTVEALTDYSNRLEVAKHEIASALSSVISNNPNSVNAVLTSDEIPKPTNSNEPLVSSLSQDAQLVGIEAGTDHQKRELYRVTFRLVPDYIKLRAAKYKPIVKFWASKYNLDPALVLGIIRQESAFNPRARSWVGAIGLMQVYPKFAGREVFKVVTKKDLIPSDNYLYNASNNIMVGVTYLQILRDNYFGNITNKKKQRYLMICAYNWSATHLKKDMEEGRLPIRAPASIVFNRLEQITPSETQNYLKRVTQYANEFRGDE